MMHIVLVTVHVKPDCVEAFQEATLENARNSCLEPGIARFDVIQSLDDPTHFVLVEIYRSLDAPRQHKETAHYTLWRDSVANMMAEPREGKRFHNIFPEDAGW
jgi:(4S)-4-hydroxy-5-phosphonooxypentane-2,3-dione isomerase